MPKTFLICFLFAVTLLSAASAPFQYPDGCRVDSHSDDGRTWRESVTVKGKYADIKKTIAVNLKKAGYRIKHDIPLSGEGGKDACCNGFRVFGDGSLLFMGLF